MHPVLPRSTHICRNTRTKKKKRNSLYFKPFLASSPSLFPKESSWKIILTPEGDFQPTPTVCCLPAALKPLCWAAHGLCAAGLSGGPCLLNSHSCIQWDISFLKLPALWASVTTSSWCHPPCPYALSHSRGIQFHLSVDNTQVPVSRPQIQWSKCCRIAVSDREPSLTSLR